MTPDADFTLLGMSCKDAVQKINSSDICYSSSNEKVINVELFLVIYMDVHIR